MFALPERVHTAVEYLKTKVGSEGTIVLFGSRSRSGKRAGGDFDIGIVAGERTTWPQFCVWRNEAMDIAWPYVIDVVDLRRAPDDFLEVIREDTVLLHGTIHDKRLIKETA